MGVVLSKRMKLAWLQCCSDSCVLCGAVLGVGGVPGEMCVVCGGGICDAIFMALTS